MPSFAVLGEQQESLADLTAGIVAALERHGFESANGAPPALVLNLVDAARPRPFRRHARGTFAAALWSLPAPPVDALRETYPMLVRALANISLCYVPGHGVLFTTMERGCYLVPDGPDLAETLVARLEPLATSHLVIDNEFRRDLEPELWRGDALTFEIGEAGRRLERLGLLPAPFPVEELVSEQDCRTATSRPARTSAASG
jgi:hypothetical protein